MYVAQNSKPETNTANMNRYMTERWTCRWNDNIGGGGGGNLCFFISIGILNSFHFFKTLKSQSL